VRFALRALAAMVRRVGSSVCELGRRVHKVWRAHLELADFAGHYVVALGTVAVTAFGGELVAEAVIVGVSAVSALLSHQIACRWLP
jgi:hypothetical protein